MSRTVAVDKDVAVEHLDDTSGIIHPVDTVEVDNYHGLTLSTVLVTLSINFISFATILILIGSGSMASAIAAAVGGSSQTIWLSQVIAILTAVMSPPCAQAADYWGRKWIVIIAALFNFTGCIITSRCTSMGMAIAGQVIAGVGFGSQPLLYAITSEILPRRTRAAAQAGMMSAISLASIVSIPVGSVLVKRYQEGFRIYYYIVSGIVAVAAFLCAVFYRPPPRSLEKSFTFRQKILQLDWIGYFLMVTGLVLFSMALTWSQNPYSWKNAHILAPFILGLALLICLIIYETKFRKDGMFNHDLFRTDRNLVICLWCIFVEGMTFFASNEFLIPENATLWESDPMFAGMRFDIAFITSFVASICLGYYATILKDIRKPIILAFFSFMVFNILMAAMTLSNSKATWGYPILLGIGLSLCLTCLIAMAQLSAPLHLIALVSGLMISTRSLGGSVMLPVYKAIFTSKLSSNLGPKVAAKVLPLGLSEKYVPSLVDALSERNQTLLESIPGINSQIIAAGTQGLREAYLVSYRYIWVTAAALAFVALVSTLFLKNPSEQLTMHVDAPLEEVEKS